MHHVHEHARYAPHVAARPHAMPPPPAMARSVEPAAIGPRPGLRSAMTTPAHEARLAKVRLYAAGVDFGRTSDDYARFRPGPPASLYDRLERFAPLAGSAVLDVGCGVGWIALEAAARGASAAVGVDPSPEQVESARRLAAQRGLTCAFHIARAERTGLSDGSFDWCIASQAWHWFDHAAAGAEARRVLRPGGLIATVSFDYLPGRCPIAAASEELVLRHNPGWPMAGGTGAHLSPLFHLPGAGFEGLEQFSYEHVQSFTHESWRGRMRTCNGVAASLSPEAVAAYDRDLAAVLAERFPEDDEGRIHIMHRVWVVLARSPGPA